LFVPRFVTCYRLVLAALLTSVAATAAAADKPLTIAYQATVEPSKVAQADGAYEKALGPIQWRKFDSGADVIAAMASGDVQIGYVGSSPLAAAAARKLPIQCFFIVGLIGDAEALVVRKDGSVTEPAKLVGKKIAVPFVSTTHYSLLAALKHWQIDPKTVQILNLRPPEIAAAWLRGDIDAAYIWDPALGKIRPTARVLTTSTEVATWGAPTFDAWIVRRDYAEAHPDRVTAFARITGAAYAAYRNDANGWITATGAAQKIAKLTGANAAEVPQLLTGYRFPTLAEQAAASLLGGGTGKAIADTAAFLKTQGKVPTVLDDYTPYINARFVRDATQ
jgi:taurine transport system substrate-binding protein